MEYTIQINRKTKSGRSGKVYSEVVGKDLEVALYCAKTYFDKMTNVRIFKGKELIASLLNG